MTGNGNRSGLPERIEAGGRVWEVTEHLRDREMTDRPEITEERLAAVLGGWVLRGVKSGRGGEPERAYFGWIEHNSGWRLMRVGVAKDNNRITTAFWDTTATKRLRAGNYGYFTRHYRDLQERPNNAGLDAEPENVL